MLCRRVLNLCKATNINTQFQIPSVIDQAFSMTAAPAFLRSLVAQQEKSNTDIQIGLKFLIEENFLVKFLKMYCNVSSALALVLCLRFLI